MCPCPVDHVNVAGIQPAGWESGVPDVAFIVIGLTFFALCVAYVRGLDRIVRAVEDHEARPDDSSL